MPEVALAVIIPAFKSEFLLATLASLVNQTNKKFSVYIGDDKGDNDIPNIVDEFRSLLSLKYMRFQYNLGSVSLVKHWERCINELGVAEPWINILGDDDTWSPDFVNEFYLNKEKIEQGKHNVVRFSTKIINKNGKIVSGSFTHPKIETNGEFLKRKLKGQTRSSLSEYVFSKQAFYENDGIPEFPLAWFSDDAMWIKYSHPTGIYSINTSYANIRNSGSNISANPRLGVEKLSAMLKYYDWILDHRKLINPFDIKDFQNHYSSFLQKHTFYEKLSLSSRLKVFFQLMRISTYKGGLYFFKFLFDKVYYKIRYEKQKLFKEWKSL
jgi:glycosyltransferase involved in cell wall biosynthesis